MAVTPEGAVKARIKSALQKVGVWYWMPQGSIYGRHGASDFVCCYRGRMLCIEAKADSKRQPTKNQMAFGAEVERAGGVWWIIHAQNVIELPMLLRDFMEEIDRCFSN
jgi:hypothetical protein